MQKSHHFQQEQQDPFAAQTQGKNASDLGLIDAFDADSQNEFIAASSTVPGDEMLPIGQNLIAPNAAMTQEAQPQVG